MQAHVDTLTMFIITRTVTRDQLISQERGVKVKYSVPINFTHDSHGSTTFASLFVLIKIKSKSGKSCCVWQIFPKKIVQGTSMF